MLGKSSFLAEDNKSSLLIAFAVIGLHLALLMGFALQPKNTLKKTAGQRVVVSTVSLSPSKPSPAPATSIKATPAPSLKKEVAVSNKPQPASPPASQSKPIEKKKEPPKKIEVKKEAPKKEVPNKIEAAKTTLSKEIATLQETSKKKEQELMAKAKENFQKLQETRQQIHKPSAIHLESIPSIQFQSDTVLPASASFTEGETSYHNDLAAKLKASLRLPDYGSVKIRLTLDRSGKVAKLEIISTESAKNRTYVEKNIPALLFPHFGRHFNDASQYTFLVTLNNE